MPHRDEPIVTIAMFETEFEASLARGALEAIGIRALVPGEWTGSIAGLYSGGVSATRLQVFESSSNCAGCRSGSSPSTTRISSPSAACTSARSSIAALL